MGKIKKLATNWRIILWILFVIFAVVSIRPAFSSEGVIIKTVLKNSSSALAGIESPKPNLSPMSKEKIISINNIPIRNVKEYHAYVDSLDSERIIQLKTNKDRYKIFVKEAFKIIELNETEFVQIEEVIEVNETIDGEIVIVEKVINKTIEQPKTKKISLGIEPIGLSVSNAPTSNLRKGLDLQGGTRVLLQPAEKISDEVFSTLVDSMKQRLNVYGLTDIVVKEVRDKPKLLGDGNKYILVEIAGATEEEVQDLLAKQGKFESKIGNETVFKGGQDITYVCKTAECSGIDPNRGCGKVDDGYACGFSFSISLSPAAAKRQAFLTKNLPVIEKDQSKYLSEPLVLFLDDQEVDRLNIAADLRGRATTEIAISGSGVGTTEQQAMTQSLSDMKRLQTILITGSLPVKLDIVKTDNISPLLGAKFLKNAWLIGLLSILVVVIIVFLRYRKLVIAVPILITSLSEVLLLIGFAALVGWNLDLAAIAGIIIAVGTGVDHQIVITDETLRKESGYGGIKEKIKRAFFIILSAYFTTVVAMIPLMFAGAGLLKGFALVTIAGLTFGVFISRPAFAEVIQILLEE